MYGEDEEREEVHWDEVGDHFRTVGPLSVKISRISKLFYVIVDYSHNNSNNNVVH
jgi:hypothetical protein